MKNKLTKNMRRCVCLRCFITRRHSTMYKKQQTNFKRASMCECLSVCPGVSVCVCVCSCLFVWVYVCVIHTHTHSHIHSLTHSDTHRRTYLHTLTYTYTYTHIHTHTLTHTSGVHILRSYLLWLPWKSSSGLRRPPSSPGPIWSYFSFTHFFRNGNWKTSFWRKLEVLSWLMWKD